MLVVSGRPVILQYKRALTGLIYNLPSQKKFDIICVFAPWQQDGQSYSETDTGVNGEYAGTKLIEIFKNPSSPVKIIIVAEKLQTGFDAPVLSIMYIDKVLRTSTAVQTLGRLSRVAPDKHKVCVVDFHNTRDEMIAAFEEFEYKMIKKKSQDQDILLNSHQVPIIKNLIFDLCGVNLSKAALEFKLEILKTEHHQNSSPILDRPSEPIIENSDKINIDALKRIKRVRERNKREEESKSNPPHKSINIKKEKEELEPIYDVPAETLIFQTVPEIRKRPTFNTSMDFKPKTKRPKLQNNNTKT
jgi:type I site-specific restriction-modification system R (restriction) subunit